MSGADHPLGGLAESLANSNTPHQLIDAGFARAIIWVDESGQTHSAIAQAELPELILPWEGSALAGFSHRRLSQLCGLIAQAEQQLLRPPVIQPPAVQPEANALVAWDPQPSARYVPTEELERRFQNYDWTVDGFRLSEEQIGAIKLILSTDASVVVLTGQAGAGKSAVVRWLVANDLITICATTGRAAINVSGITVDSLFGLSRDKWEVDGARAEKNLKAARRLIGIDEASMIGENMGNLLIMLAEKYNKRLLLIGDFAQASPVKDGWGFNSRLFSNMVFIRLEECHRQDDPTFVQVLNKLRIGQVDDQVNSVMASRVGDEPTDEGWVRMYATNKLADDFNRRRLDDHCRATGSLKFSLNARFIDARSADAQKKWPRDSKFVENALSQSPLAHRESFALGCQILFTANQPKSEDREYVNGDVGRLFDVGFHVERQRLKQLGLLDQPEAPEQASESSEPEKSDLFDYDDELHARTKKSKALFNIRVEAAAEPKSDPREGLDEPPDDPELEGTDLVWLSELTPEHQLQLQDRLNSGKHVQYLVVELDRTNERVIVQKIDRDGKDGQGKVIHQVRGFPAKVGWAVTIHKTQGMTVDRAYLDMGSIRRMPEGSRHGLAYVGLSRVRTLEGLRISDWAPDVIECAAEVRHLI